VDKFFEPCPPGTLNNLGESTFHREGREAIRQVRHDESLAYITVNEL